MAERASRRRLRVTTMRIGLRALRKEAHPPNAEPRILGCERSSSQALQAGQALVDDSDKTPGAMPAQMHNVPGLAAEHGERGERRAAWLRSSRGVTLWTHGARGNHTCRPPRKPDQMRNGGRVPFKSTRPQKIREISVSLAVW
jgi:hypothetical protein